jgi:hypothetical protein
MKKAFPILLFSISLFDTRAIAGKQLTGSVKNELRTLSNQMLSAHNDNFIILDAIVDGYVTIGGKASVIYENDIVTINDKQIPDPKKSWYVDKIRLFQSAQINDKDKIKGDAGATTRFYVIDLKVTLAEIFDTASSFRKNLAQHLPTHEEVLKQEEDKAMLVGMLAADKLIDTSTDFTIRYNILGLFLNNVKVEEAVAAKFVKYINVHWLLAKEKSDYLYVDKTQWILSSNND